MAEKFKRGRLDLPILLLLPIIAAVVSLALKTNYFWTIIFFLGTPSVYLSFREPRYIKKTFVFSLLASIPAIVVIDFIGQKTGQWIIPSSVSPIRLFGTTQVEQLLWAFLNFYSVIIFYKHFLDRHYSRKVWGRRLKYVVIIGLLLMGPFLLFLWQKPEILNIPYFYFLFGLALIAVPAIGEPLKKPNLASRFLKTATYFFYLSFIFEITALQLGCWIFPSTQFVGWIEVSSIRFPIEELIFWIILFSMAVLGVYEKFDEEEKY